MKTTFDIVGECLNPRCAKPMRSKWAYEKGIHVEGAEAYHKANGYCSRCYARMAHHGTPDALKPAERKRPPARGSVSLSAEEVLEDWALIRDGEPGGGLTVAAGAARIGMSLSALEQCLYRARQRGDRRGGRAPFGTDVRSTT